MKIYSVKDNVDLNTLSLGNPGRLQGGSYYSKLFLNNDSVFLKVEYCATKQGIVNTNHKTHTDLLLTINESEYIDWFTNLETQIKSLLNTKANDWFTHDLSPDDIEHFYNSCMKTYKTNQTLLRTFIDTSSGNQSCSIFDENKVACEPSGVENRKIATILHIKGIRLTSTSFQLDIENKQILILEDRNVFDECMFDVSKPISDSQTKPMSRDTKPKNQSNSSSSENLDEAKISSNSNSNSSSNSNSNSNSKDEVVLESSSELKEVDLNHFVNKDNKETEDHEEKKTNLKLKTPQDVYQEMYKLAKRRANETRKQAIKAYIDAQNIKAAYLIKDDQNEGMNSNYPYNNISESDNSSDLDSDDSSDLDSEGGSDMEESTELQQED